MIEAAKKSTETLKTRIELTRKGHELFHQFRLDATKLGTQLRDVQSPSGEGILKFVDTLKFAASILELEEIMLNAQLNQEVGIKPPELVTA